MINLFSEAVRQSPYAMYKQLRQSGSAIYDKKQDLWCVGRYSDVKQILNDSHLFFSKTNHSGFIPVILDDGETHSRIRKALQPAFKSKVLSQQVSRINKLTKQSAIQLAQHKGEVDFVTEFSAKIPAIVFAWMMGASESLYQNFWLWAKTMQKMGGRKTILNNGDENRLLLEQCQQLLENIFEHALRKGSDGWLMQVMLDAYKKNNLNFEEIVNIEQFLMIAAHETTGHLISNSILLLAQETDVKHRVWRNKKLIKPFLEEMMRYDSPVQARYRIAISDVMVGDVLIPADSKVMVFIGSANRDEDFFPKADQFLLDRNPNNHLAFGSGVHTCLGAQLGRIESFSALNALRKHLPKFQLIEQEIQYPDFWSIRGPNQLMIHIAH